MADLKDAREKPADQLWDQIDDVKAGMLGVEGSGQHMQPMAPQLDRDANKIWFFTKKSSDLLKAVGDGAKAHFCVVGEHHDYHACLAGRLRENRDAAKIDEYWNPVVAAWYPEGKDDPDMTLLELSLEDAAIWASKGNPILFGWEIAKANATHEEPDLGVRNHIAFAA